MLRNYADMSAQGRELSDILEMVAEPLESIAGSLEMLVAKTALMDSKLEAVVLALVALPGVELQLWREPDGSLSAGLARNSGPAGYPQLFCQANQKGANPIMGVLLRLALTQLNGAFHIPEDELPF